MEITVCIRGFRTARPWHGASYRESAGVDATVSIWVPYSMVIGFTTTLMLDFLLSAEFSLKLGIIEWVLSSLQEY